jgi:predicted ferric reductase
VKPVQWLWALVARALRGLAVVVLLVLVVRLPWLETRLGMDRLTAWHRWSGFWVPWLGLTHLVLTVGPRR